MRETATGMLTKRMLTDSLKRLMQQKPLDRISIKEITDGCGMQRQTFYYYFKDIYDQIRWLYEQDISAFLRRDRGTSWQEGILNLFYYVRENRVVCQNILKFIGREHLRYFFYDDVHRLVRKAALDFRETSDCDPAYASYLARFLALAFAGILESWVLGEMDEEPETVVAYIEIFIQDQAAGAAYRIQNENRKKDTRV